MAKALSLAQTAYCPHHNDCSSIFAEQKKLSENGKCFFNPVSGKTGSMAAPISNPRCN